MVLNPFASVKGEPYQVVEGRTPEITISQARTLLGSIDTSRLVGLRDRALFGTLCYTGARIGAVLALRRANLVEATLRLSEKGGKQRIVPVRADLGGWLVAWVEAAGIAAADAPLFQGVAGRSRRRLGNRSVVLLERGAQPAQARPPCRGLAGDAPAAFVPGSRGDGPPGAGRAVGGCANARRPQPTADDGAVRSPGTADRSERGRANFHLISPFCGGASAESWGSRAVSTLPGGTIPNESDPPRPGGRTGETPARLPGPKTGGF